MSWNNVKQLPWFPVSLLLSPSLRFPNAPLKWSHGSGNSSLAPAHRRSHPKTTLVQTEWQTRDDTVSSASYAQHVPWFNAGGKSDDAAEFCWCGVFPISTGAQQTEKYHLLNNYPKNFVGKLNIFWKMKFEKVEIVMQSFKGSVFVLCRHGVAPSRVPYLHTLLLLTCRDVTEKHASTGFKALQSMQTMKPSFLIK